MNSYSRRASGRHGLAFATAVALVLLGFAVRLNQLTAAPMGIGGDEMFYYLDAHRLLYEGYWRVYYPTNFGHEPLFIFIEAAIVRLIGGHAFAMRFSAVIGGALLMSGAYALAARLFNRRVGLVTLALFAGVFWPVFITRVGLRAFTFPLALVFGLYSLWRAVTGRSWAWALAAGVLNGLVAYTYIASRVFPAVIGLWILAIGLWHRPWLRANAARLALVLGIAAALSAPLVAYGRANPDVFNQRPNTMRTALSDFQQGRIEAGLRSLADNAVGIVGMFAFRGDPDERYNYNARPIFDPVIGGLAYAGLIVAALRWRRPAYLLLWLSFLVGLTPVLLSDAAPAFLRAGGALFACMVFPALAVDEALRRLGGVTRVAGIRLISGLTLVGSPILGASTLAVFNGPWRTSAEMIHVYEGSLYLAARYLADNPPGPDVPVVGVARFAHDNAPWIFGLQSPRPVDVRWSQDMVWPAAGGETWYFFLRDSLPDARTRAWLGQPPSHVERDSAGQPILEVYRLAQRPAPPGELQASGARYDRLADLIGVDYPGPWTRGQPAEALLFWRVRPDLDFDPSRPIGVKLRLVAQEVEWSQGGAALLAFPPHQWRPGDVWVQRVSLLVPPDMPPQTVRPELTLHQEAVEWPVIPEDSERARPTLALPAVPIVGAPAAVDPLPADAIEMGDGLTLVSASLAPPAIGAQPGLTATLKLTWQVSITPNSNHAIELRLAEGERQVPLGPARLLGEGYYPTARWQPGERVTTALPVRIPVDIATGEYVLQVRLTDSAGGPHSDWIETAVMSVAGRPHLMEPPRIDRAVDAAFGDVADLVGYRLDLTGASPGGGVRLVLVWRARQASASPLKVFAHLYDLADTINVYAQHDGEPGGGLIPTVTWVGGEYIEDPHTLVLGAGLAPGRYRLGVGMYDPASLRRLDVEHSGLTSDALILEEIVIR